MRQRVLTFRDTDSVQRLAQRLQAARRVVVVGNGGIALELM
jgi:DNA-binding MurR/RpiR family transcriptional regulator